MCFDLLKSADNISKVTVIDRDMILVNGVATVFPKTTTLVCQFYIFKNREILTGAPGLWLRKQI